MNNKKNMSIGEVQIADDVVGVKVTVGEDSVAVELSLNIAYGYNVPEVSEKVQDKVKAAIENMTGLKVKEVNIHVAGVAIENDNL